MKPIKHSIAYVIYHEERSQFLSVKRPSDDDDLPDVWGLPAGSLKNGETFEDAVLRSGREKLGVELKIVKLIGEGNIEREHDILHMKEYEVHVIQGEVNVPQLVDGVTQYQAWKWATPDELIESAQKGSLCSRLYLSSRNQEWFSLT
ncbi:MAG: NUDIX domain-containing protein [Candidatus Tectomicrobia bacterium]|nr:NUDIX domain-containing protein [Candidatus Tectomicrobia bacterium]